jgi:transcriptional regulator with XRE-family HTH domain
MRQALSQRALATRLGVKQQTVSRWEKGQSKPQAAMMGKLAAVLDVPVDDLTGAIRAEMRAAGTSGDTLEPAVRPLVDVLPMGGLPADRFEQFVADLLERRCPDATVSRLGGQGDDQRGYDILLEHADGRKVGVQCKREQQFGPKKIEKAISVAELDVDESIIALARPATSAARFEIDKHPQWVLWDQEDMSRQVRQLPRESALRLVDSFFQGYREPFLGIRAPGPWLTVDEFFPVSATTLLHHRQALAGRQATVDEIADWLDDAEESPIGVLIGRGGLGKSKLLFEVAARTYDQPVNFRFLAVGHTPMPESFDALPNDGRLVVVIDDAHNVDAIAGIAAQLRLRRQTVKLLLATRPYGETLLDTEIWKLNQSPRVTARWTLEDLSNEEITSLVSELIGRPVNDLMTRQLAAISADCPFVAVVAADLLKRKALSASTFSSSNDLRVEVLQRFTELTISHGGSLVASERRTVLAALSAFQPVRLNDLDFQDAMTALTRVPSWDLVSGRIRELEDSGLVLRRGDSVRVVPDTLGDILLGQVAFDDRSQIGTTYLKRAQAAATGAPLQHLLVNASRMDWQVRDGVPTRTDMVGGLWATLHEELLAADYDEQVQLLKLVAKMAFYQPESALVLMKDVLKLEPHESAASPADDQWRFTRQDVLKAIPPILRNIAYNLAYLGECLELLWVLAQNDTRPTNQFPDHPLRVLSEIADLHTGKPLAYIHAVIDVAEHWFDKPASGNISPFDVLEPILAAEGSHQISSDLGLTFHPFGIRPESVREVRSRVIDLAVRQAESSEPAEAVRAMRTLEHAIRGPTGMFNRTPTVEERAEWAAEFLPVISQIGVIGSKPEHDPAVRIAIRQALGGHAAHSTTETKAAAQEALSQLATSPEDDLALCLHDGWGRLAMRSGLSYEEAERARTIQFKHVAETVTRGQTDDDVLQLLEGRLAIEHAAFKDVGSPDRFLWDLFEVRPSVAARLCEQTLSGRFGELRKFLPQAIAVLANAADPRAVDFSSKMMACPSAELQRAAAWGLSWNRGLRAHLLDGEVELLGQLAQHPDEDVRGAMGRAVYLIGLSNKVVALDLLSRLQFGRSGKVASDALSCLITQGSLNWSETDLSLRKSIKAQLIECDSIDSYQVITAIAELSQIEPLRVTQLLIARIERQATMEAAGYTALPSRWDPALKIRETSELERCLIEVRDWMMEVNRDKPYYLNDDGAGLYTLIAGEWDDQALAVLSDFDTVNPRAAALVVARILGQAPIHVLYDNVALVTKTLRRAEELGGDTARLVSQIMIDPISFTARSLWGSAPPAEDVQQRDQATEIAKQLPRGSVEGKFYQSLVREAESRISWMTERTDRRLDRRDW